MVYQYQKYKLLSPIQLHSSLYRMKSRLKPLWTGRMQAGRRILKLDLVQVPLIKKYIPFIFLKVIIDIEIGIYAITIR